MLNIIADALLIAIRMGPVSRRPGEGRARHEGDYTDRRQDPPSRQFSHPGARL